MRRNLATLAAVLVAAVLVAFALGGPRRAPQATPEPSPSPEVLSAIPVEADHRIGGGRAFGDLTVFPVLASDQPNLGPFVTLEQALSDKTAEVREADAGGRVGSLVIENKGETSIFVLAGTVVKGGKQDRQIAQDFAVGPHQTVPVDAFCVEPHRWNVEREGVATQGKFTTEKTLAVGSVRAAGQYKQNQGEVWAKVGEVNAQNGKAPATGSLMASLDDQEIAAQRSSLAHEISGFLGGLDPQAEVVGVAYAVEGQVRGVRWFANHRLYEMYRESLVNTAAVEAITAQHARAKAGAPGTPPALAVTPRSVKAFIDAIEAAPVAEERDTGGENVNAYRKSKAGYGSAATLKGSPGRSPGPVGSSTASLAATTAQRKTPISADFSYGY
jgi:hypothetical protein